MTRLIRLLDIGVVVLLVAACAQSTGPSPVAPTLVAPSAQTSATATPASVATSPATSAAAIVLRVGTVEPEESPEGQAIAYFADRIADLSSGSITIVPVSAYGESDQENIKQVASGLLDLAIVQARNWDEFGVTTMQALQTPFLVTSEAAAAAATSTELAERLMSGLGAQGAKGLAMWPIDLRHPVSFGKPLLSPDDFKGLKIRIVGSTITRDVVKALGAIPVAEYDDSVGGGESAFDRAYSLPEPGTFTGNVTFYPRVDVFFAKQAVLDRLSPAQLEVVRTAVEATRQHVIEGIVSDADLAKAYCADAGGAVAMASDAQLAEFTKALAPIEAEIATDPTSKDLIARIRDLTKGLAAGTPVATCGKP